MLYFDKLYLIDSFYPRALRAIVFTHGVWLGKQAVGKVCPDCIPETNKSRMLILGRTLVEGCRSATSWCDLVLTFDLAVVTLSFKNLVWAISC